MKNIVKILFSLVFILLTTSGYAGGTAFTKEQIKDDMAFLDSIIRAVHPAPFYSISKEKYELQKKKLLLSFPDSVSQEKAYLLMAPLLASLKDGHSSMMTPYGPLVDYLKAGGKVFPVDIHLSDGKIFVKADLYRNSLFEENTELTSINGVNSYLIMDSILKLYPVELSEDLYYNTIERDFYILLLYADLLTEENIELGLKRGNNERVYETKMIPYSLYQKNKKIEKSSPYSFWVDEHKKEAIVRLKNFLPSDRYYSFIDSLFNTVEQKKVRSLILDIRGNSGGSSDAVDTLMSHLYKGYYNLYSETYLKISEATKNKYLKRDPCFYAVIKNKPLGDLIREDIKSTYSCRPNVYMGILKIWVDKSTYSGAASFANLVKELKLGTVSGICGGRNLYFGDFIVFELPNTKLQFSVSTKKFIEYIAEPEKL